jgi:hypothetical protein
MAKSSALSYHPPFRYKRPAEDLQAVFGAQTGNPPIVPSGNKKKTGKRPAPPKKRPSAPAAKSSKAAAAKATKPAAPKPATSTKATAKAKAKKPAGKR